jgi:hypothetical protein
MFKIIGNPLIQEQQIKFGLVAAILIKTSALPPSIPPIYEA